MKDSMFWIATILYALAIAFAYFNRASEKVVTTVFLGMAALVGAVLAVTIFSSEHGIRKAFSVPIIVHADARLPVEELPYSVLPTFLSIKVRDKLTAHPELFNPQDSFGRNIYHHVLQRAIIFWLEQRYPKTWQVDEFPMTLGEMSGYAFQSRKVPTRLYSESEIAARLSGNTFADMVGPFGGSPQFGLAVPEGTDLTISAPHMDSARGEISSIKLHNRFCTITIDTHFGSSMVGAGSYRMILGMSQEQSQKALKSNQYIVVVSVTFNRFLTGNPEMPNYRKWASDISDGLEAQFSDQVVWSKTRDWLLFHRIAGM
ncbi:MAG: hypothetical protein JWN74_382 [Acidobacteriaceae bacterium]|nr:hypothetical protein [Acidobacteriaceae bacterium]